METTEKFKELILKQKEISFIEPLDVTDEEAAGLLLSHVFEWNGLAILKACYAALEDANFHTENEVIQQLIDKIEKGE